MLRTFVIQNAELLAVIIFMLVCRCQLYYVSACDNENERNVNLYLQKRNFLQSMQYDEKIIITKLH